MEAISSDLTPFVFVKWHGGDVDIDMVKGMLRAEAVVNYFIQVPGHTFGFAECASNQDAVACCNSVNGIIFDGATFRLCIMPEEPVIAQIDNVPANTKFRADMNKTIKHRAHLRLVASEGAEKAARKKSSMRKAWEKEAPHVLKREEIKADALLIQEKLCIGGSLSPAFLRAGDSTEMIVANRSTIASQLQFQVEKIFRCPVKVDTDSTLKSVTLDGVPKGTVCSEGFVVLVEFHLKPV